jgi:predicted  nucleic acid-binding Zn-ribbon protein
VTGTVQTLSQAERRIVKLEGDIKGYKTKVCDLQEQLDNSSDKHIELQQELARYQEAEFGSEMDAISNSLSGTNV